jgi:hypothetical protein
MKPAVLMMFRDEADILGRCLEHWYDLGVRDFYLCDNSSADDSLKIAREFIYENSIYQPHEIGIVIQDPATDWPGRRVINDLKNRAIADGCNWIFPADADEFLQLPEGHGTIQEWLQAYGPGPGWGELPYLNILPDGREEWNDPQRKAFGIFQKEWMISMGNHLIEGVAPTLATGAYYKHYSLRSYPQFRRKMENYMTAFHQTPFQDHHHAVDFHHWQAEGEVFIRRRWTELTGLEV